MDQLIDNPQIAGMEIYQDVTTNDDYYVYGNGLVSHGNSGSSSRSYYLEDGLGNVRFVTDSSGDTVAEYEYDP